MSRLPFFFFPHVQSLELSYSVSVCAFALLLHANCICIPATVCLFVCTNVYLIGYCSAFLVSGPNFCTGSVGREEIRFIFTGMLEEKQYLKNTFRGDFIYEGSWAEDKQEVFSLKRKPSLITVKTTGLVASVRKKSVQRRQRNKQEFIQYRGSPFTAYTRALPPSLPPSLTFSLTRPLTQYRFISLSLSHSVAVLWRMGIHCQGGFRGEKSVFLFFSGVFSFSSAWLPSWAVNSNPGPEDEEDLFVRKTQQRKRKQGATGWQISATGSEQKKELFFF